MNEQPLMLSLQGVVMMPVELGSMHGVYCTEYPDGKLEIFKIPVIAMAVVPQDCYGEWHYVVKTIGQRYSDKLFMFLDDGTDRYADLTEDIFLGYELSGGDPNWVDRAKKEVDRREERGARENKKATN